MADIDRVFLEALAGYTRPDENGKKAIAVLDGFRETQTDLFCAKLTQFCVAETVDDATRILCLVLLRNALIKEPVLAAETLEGLKVNILALHGKFEPTSQVTQKAADALAVIAHICHSQNGSFPEVIHRTEESQTPQIHTRSMYLLRRLLESSSVSSTLAPFANNLVGLLQTGMQAADEPVKLQALFAMTACLLNNNSPEILLKSLPSLGELALSVALEAGSVEAINSLTEAADTLGDLNGKVPSIVTVIAERVLMQAKTVEELPSVDLAVACLAFLEELISTDSFKTLHSKSMTICQCLIAVGTHLMALYEQTADALANWAEDAPEDDQCRIDEGACKLINRVVTAFAPDVVAPCFANALKFQMQKGTPQASYAGLRIASSLVALFPKKFFKSEIPSMFNLCRHHINAETFLQKDLRVVWAAMAVQKEIFDAYSPSVQRQAKMGADLPFIVQNLLSIGGQCCQHLEKPGFETVLFQVLVTLKAIFPTDDEEDEKRCLSNVKDFATLKPLMEGTLQQFISPLLQHPKAGLACKARALELLAAFVDLYQSAFSGEKFASTVGLVKAIFAQAAANPGMEGTLDMAEAAVLLIGNMCIAVPKEEFIPHADDLVGKLQGFLSGSQGEANSVAALGGDSMNREILKTLMIVAGRMGSDFAPYVSMVLPSILAKASQSDATIEQKDAANCNSDDYKTGTQLVGTSGRIRFVQRIDAGSLLVIEFNQFTLEETQLAVESIGELAANMGPAFLPHLEGALKALGAAMHHPMSMVRVAAVLAVGEVLSVVLRVPMNEKVNLEESPDAFTAPETEIVAQLLRVLLDTTFVPPAQGLSLIGLKSAEEAQKEQKTSYSVMGAILKIVHKNDDSASLSKYAMRALLTPLEALSLAMHEAANRGPEHRVILQQAIASAGEGLFFTETFRVLGGILTDMAQEILKGAGVTAPAAAAAPDAEDDEEDDEDDFEDYEDNATPAEKVVDSAHQVVSAILRISHSCAPPAVHDRIRQSWLENIAPVLTAGLGLSPSVPRLTSDACLVASLLNVADFVRLGANNQLVFATDLTNTSAPSTSQQPDAVVIQLAEKALSEAVKRLRIDPALLTDDAEVGDALMILQGAAYLVGAVVETVPQVASAAFEEIIAGLAFTLTTCTDEDYRMLLDTFTTALLKIVAVTLKQSNGQATGKAEEALNLLLKVNALPVREEVIEAVVGNDILLELVAQTGLGSQWGQGLNGALRGLLSALNEQPWLISAGARSSNLIARAAQKLM